MSRPDRPIEKVALAVSVVAFVLGVVCVIGAGPEVFGARCSPEREQLNRSPEKQALVKSFTTLAWHTSPCRLHTI